MLAHLRNSKTPGPISGGPKWPLKASPKAFQSVSEESPRLRWRAHGFPRRRQGWTKHPQRLCLEGLGLPRFPQRLCLRRSDDRLFRWAVPSSCFRPERLFLRGASFRLFCHDGLSKRFIQTFLSSSSCRRFRLDVSSFFRALHEGTLVHTYIHP